MCFDEEATVKFTECGHACVCRACVERMTQDNQTPNCLLRCPMCRAAVNDYTVAVPAGKTAAELRAAGYSAKDLMREQARFTLAQLKLADFTARELQEAGFTLAGTAPLKRQRIRSPPPEDRTQSPKREVSRGRR